MRWWLITSLLCMAAISPLATTQQPPKVEPPVVEGKYRGGKRTPFGKIIESIKSGRASIHRAVAPPPQVVTVPKRLSYWGNNQYGCCVTSESVFAIADYSTAIGQEEIFVTDAATIAWARAHGWLNGAFLLDVIQDMQADGIKDEKGVLRKAGKPSSVDFANEDTLKSAIAQGPVSIAIDAGALPSGAGNKSGWFAFGGRANMNTDHCFTGDTRVSLLNGKELSLAELANGEAGEEFWVYSCDSDGNIVAGKAHSARKTRENAELIKVILDNGESIRCTPDHSFLMRDGSYKEAKDLRPDDSLMPLYRRVSPGGYELCYNPKISGKRGWRATHRIVAYGPGGRTGGMAAHHVDFDKRNNDPANLRIMTPADHASLHARLSERSRSSEHRAMARELMSSLWADPVWAENQRAKLSVSASIRGKKTAKLGHAHLQTISEEERGAMAKRAGLALKGRKRSSDAVRKSVEGLKRKTAIDPDFREKRRIRALDASKAAAAKPVTDKQRQARRENAKKLNERHAGNRQVNNHKVISVQSSGREDVYDLTVDDYHNFALSAGVFVHNCVSLHGYGPTSELFRALNVTAPSNAPANGYYLYTWSTIGVVDHAWLLNTCVEAWVRNPTTTDLAPPVPPGPAPSTITVAVPNVTGGVGSPVKITPTAAGGVSPYIFLFAYGDAVEDAAGTHTYKNSGTYTVTVTAVDSKGSIGTGTCVASIGVNPPQPPGPGPSGLTIMLPQNTPAGTYILTLPSDLEEIQRRLDAIRGLSKQSKGE